MTPVRVFDQVVSTRDCDRGRHPGRASGGPNHGGRRGLQRHGDTSDRGGSPAHATGAPDDPLTPTSVLNWSGLSDVVANSGIAPVANGEVRLYNGGTTAQVLIDVEGFFVNSGAGAYFYPVDPQRVLDTRTAAGGGTLGPGETRVVAVGSGVGVGGNWSVRWWSPRRPRRWRST